MLTSESVSEKKIENRSTFGEVMDNIVVHCFFDSQCRYIFSRLDLYNNVILIFAPNFLLSKANSCGNINYKLEGVGFYWNTL